MVLARFGSDERLGGLYNRRANVVLSRSLVEWSGWNSQRIVDCNALSAVRWVQNNGNKGNVPFSVAEALDETVG